MDADRLAELLADRLTRIAPSGFHVQAAGGMICCSADKNRFPGQQGNYQLGSSGTFVRENLGRRGENVDDRVVVVAVAELALDELQDYIDEATHDPWPGELRVPRPHAEIRGSTLHMWYGDGAKVVLACEPIPLEEIE